MTLLILEYFSVTNHNEQNITTFYSKDKASSKMVKVYLPFLPQISFNIYIFQNNSIL